MSFIVVNQQMKEEMRASGEPDPIGNLLGGDDKKAKVSLYVAGWDNLPYQLLLSFFNLSSCLCPPRSLPPQQTTNGWHTSTGQATACYISDLEPKVFFAVTNKNKKFRRMM